MLIYNDRIEIVNPDLVIPYSAISNIQNIDKDKISAGRVIALGLIWLPLAIVGAMWKKNHIYNVIQYKDGTDEKTIVMDFDRDVYRIQPLIYNKIIEFKGE